MSDEIIGYRFAPVTDADFSGMQVASSSSCPVSRRGIRGCGGRRDILHPAVVDLILNDKTAQDLLRIRLREKDLET